MSVVANNKIITSAYLQDEYEHDIDHYQSLYDVFNRIKTSYLSRFADTKYAFIIVGTWVDVAKALVVCYVGGTVGVSFLYSDQKVCITPLDSAPDPLREAYQQVSRTT